MTCSLTLEASVRSWFRQNRYAQVFATAFGWCCVYPTKKKRDAHHGLSLMAARDGVPPYLIMDGSKAHTLGEFRKKKRQFGCHIKQPEPYPPWKIMLEGATRELKRGSGQKMMRSLLPSKLWDHCIKLEALIRSHTTLDIYGLQGQVPETLLSGKTTDISPFIEHKWYSFVKWFNHGSSFPESKEVHGRWLGPSMDIVPAVWTSMSCREKCLRHSCLGKPRIYLHS